MTTRKDQKGFEPSVECNGSTLCLACGLCCDGVLHAQTVVKLHEIERMRTLGLTVEALRDGLGFRQPCSPYRGQRCSVYPNHPPTCQTYQCDLIKKHLAGTITYEQGTQIVQRTRDWAAFDAAMEMLIKHMVNAIDTAKQSR
jgi:hypothetical protein